MYKENLNKSFKMEQKISDTFREIAHLKKIYCRTKVKMAHNFTGKNVKNQYFKCFSEKFSFLRFLLKLFGKQGWNFLGIGNFLKQGEIF